MEMSIREAKARFSEAVAAAERGESITVTRDGRAVAQIGPPPPPRRKGGFDFEAAERYLKEKGWDKLELEWPDYFDDPAYSRKVLGLED